MQPFNLPCNFVGGISALMWCYVRNSGFLIVFWLCQNRKESSSSVFKIQPIWRLLGRFILYCVSFFGIYVAEKDTGNKNTDWKYVASTTDLLTSDCHIHFKIYELLKLQWYGLVVRETFANRLLFQCNRTKPKPLVGENPFIKSKVDYKYFGNWFCY